MVVILLLSIWVIFGPLARFLDRRYSRAWAKSFRRDGTCHYREDGLREVIPSGFNWVVMRQDSGDRDILPIGEEEDHGRGPGCACDPRVDVVGALLVTVHNSFDHREIVEEALKIMNGVDK